MAAVTNRGLRDGYSSGQLSFINANSNPLAFPQNPSKFFQGNPEKKNNSTKQASELILSLENPEFIGSFSEIANSSYDAKVKELAIEVDHFVQKVSTFGAMKGAIQYVCGVKIKENTAYSNAINEVLSVNTGLGEMYQVFCREITNPKIGLSPFKQMLAKASFSFLQPILFHLLEEGKNSLSTYAQKFMEKNSADGFKKFKAEVFFSLESYLQILTEAYQAIAQNPDATFSVHDLVEKRITEAKDEVHGYSKSELYKRFTNWFFDQWTPSLQLISVIRQGLASIRIAESSRFSGLNRALSVFTGLLSFVISSLLYIPEKGLNTLIQYLARSYLKSGIETFLQTHLKMPPAKKDELLRQSLKQILVHLKKPDDPILTLQTLPTEEKTRLESLVRCVFDLLDYSKANNPEKLREIQNSRSITQIQQENSSLFTHISTVFSVATGYTALSELTPVRELLISKIVSKAENLIADKLQKERLVVQALEIIHVACTVLATMDNVVKPINEKQKNINDYLNEIVSTLSKSDQQIRTEWNRDIINKYVTDFKLYTTEFSQKATAFLKNVEDFFSSNEATLHTESFTKEIDNFRKTIQDFDEKLKKSMEDLKKQPFVDENTSNFLVSYKTSISEYLQNGNLHAEIINIHNYFKEFAKTQNQLEKPKKLAESLKEISDIDVNTTWDLIQKVSQNYIQACKGLKKSGSLFIDPLLGTILQQLQNPKTLLDKKNEATISIFQENVKKLSFSLKVHIEEEKLLIDSNKDASISLIEKTNVVFQKISQLNEDLEAPTIKATNYLQSAKELTAPLLTNSIQTNIIIPLLQMILDPKNHVYGAIHPFMFAAIHSDLSVK